MPKAVTIGETYYPNGDPDAVLWWTGVLTEPLKIPANLTRGLSIIINPLIRLPWDFTADEPMWVRDPMAFSVARPGTADFGRRPFLERESRFDFWSRWLRDAIVFGLGVFSYEHDQAGQPMAGTLLRHDPRGILAPVEDPGEDWMILYRGELKAIDERGNIEGTARRLHFVRGHEGGIVSAHASELLFANRVLSYGNETFDSGTPSGVLTTDQPLNQTQADRARQAWGERHTRRGIAVLGNGTRYQQVVMSPVDAELASMARMSNTQVAHMLELAAYEIDGDSGGSMTYANIVDRRQDRVDGTLASWAARIEESVSAVLPYGQTMMIDFTQYRMPTGGPGNAAAEQGTSDNGPGNRPENGDSQMRPA